MLLQQLIYLFILISPNVEAGNYETIDFFAGITPCNNIIRPIHQIALEPDCELNECKCILVEWKLTLFYNVSTGQPSTFKLTGINRYSVKETNMFSEPGTKTECSGKWTMIKGTGNQAGKTIYRLNPDRAELMLDILKLSENVLHILDKEDKLMIGNEFFSYTLNRVSN